MKKFTLFFFLISMFFLAGQVEAAASSQPDPNANPVLANLGKQGAKFYYLGVRAGLNGWFVLKDNQIQVAYVTADNQTAIVGAMFDNAGQNVTMLQVKTLFDTNKELKAIMDNVLKQQGEIAKVGAAPGGMASLPDSVAPPAAVAAPSPSPGEQLIQALQTAAGVNVGAPTAPLLLMVVDPNCPHCKDTWHAMRDSVFKNKLQIRLIPIGTENTDSEKSAAQLLHAANPLETWDKYVAGDHNQLAGTPDPTLLNAVRSNHTVIDAWNIQATPYLVYHSKDGRVKIVQGEPDKIGAVLSDIGL